MPTTIIASVAQDAPRGDRRRRLAQRQPLGRDQRAIMEQAFYELDAPVGRVCSAEVPIPYPQHLEEAALPQVGDRRGRAATLGRADDRVPHAVARRRHGAGTLVEWLKKPGDRGQARRHRRRRGNPQGRDRGRDLRGRRRRTLARRAGTGSGRHAARADRRRPASRAPARPPSRRGGAARDGTPSPPPAAIVRAARTAARGRRPRRRRPPAGWRASAASTLGRATGSGPGRRDRADVERAAARPAPLRARRAPRPRRDAPRDRGCDGRSKREIPHYYLARPSTSTRR